MKAKIQIAYTILLQRKQMHRVLMMVAHRKNKEVKLQSKANGNDVKLHLLFTENCFLRGH